MRDIRGGKVPEEYYGGRRGKFVYREKPGTRKIGNEEGKDKQVKKSRAGDFQGGR